MTNIVRGIIYKVTNLVDGKIYVGQTIQTLWRRRRAHENLSLRPSTYFHRALSKHGILNFSWSILETCDTKTSLHAREKFWITQFACMAPSGYNSAEGGKGGAYLESHKRRISEALKGRKISDSHRLAVSVANKGSKRSDIVKQKMSESRKGSGNNFFGKTHDDETKRKIGEKSKNRNWFTGRRYKIESVVNLSLVLELYFKKFTYQQIMDAHLNVAGIKINQLKLIRVFNLLGLFVSNRRGKIAVQERHKFIDENKIEDFFAKTILST